MLAERCSGVRHEHRQGRSGRCEMLKVPAVSRTQNGNRAFHNEARQSVESGSCAHPRDSSPNLRNETVALAASDIAAVGKFPSDLLGNRVDFDSAGPVRRRGHPPERLAVVEIRPDSLAPDFHRGNAHGVFE